MTDDDGVDFVEDDDPHGHDEDLPQHPSRARAVQAWRPQVEGFLRSRYGLPMLVVIAVLALLVGRALMHKKPLGTPAASRSGTSAVPLRTGTDPTHCPGLQCYTSSSVPDAVRAAVRAVFPAATFTATETIRLNDQAQGNPLWYREVDARVGSATLVVRVQAHADGDTPDGTANDDGHQDIVNVDAPLQQWFVRLRVIDRSGSAEPFNQLSALVDDPRLLQV